MLIISVLSFPVLISGAKLGYWARVPLVFSVAFLLLSPQMSYVAEAASGDLDPSFGMGGVVRTDFFGLTDEVRAIAIQADNKVVAVGAVITPTSGASFGLARYDPNGSLDLTFGSGGKVTTDLGGTQEAAEDVAIQPDGKIVVAGHTGAPYSSDSSDFVVARYIPNGGLDPTFGVGGVVRTHFAGFSDAALAIALQPDGKIVAAGAGVENNEPGGGVFNYSAMARYNTDGSLDQTFGSGGKVRTGGAGIVDLALQQDGKIVAAAGFTFLLYRFNTNGSPDSNFGSGGHVDNSAIPGALLTSLGVAIQTDGKIVCAGGARTPSSSTLDFGLVRFNTGGSLDTTFGAGGVAVTDLGNNEAAWDVAIQTNEKIVISGTSNERFATARFNPNGSLDNTFQIATPDFGCVSQPVSNPISIAYAVAVYPDGKIIAGGTACSPRDFVLARYNGDSTSRNLCIQDDANGNLLTLNSVTGDYQFVACSNGLVIGGAGILTKRGDNLTLQDFGGNRRVLARIDGGANRATAAVQVLSLATTFTITDRDTRNNNCLCP